MSRSPKNYFWGYKRKSETTTDNFSMENSSHWDIQLHRSDLNQVKRERERREERKGKERKVKEGKERKGEKRRGVEEKVREERSGGEKGKT